MPRSLDFNPTPPSDGDVGFGLSTRRYNTVHTKAVRADSVVGSSVECDDLVALRSVVNTGGIVVKNQDYKRVTVAGATAVYQGALDDDSGNGYDQELTAGQAPVFGTDPYPYIETDTGTRLRSAPIPSAQNATRVSFAAWLYVPTGNLASGSRQNLLNLGRDGGTDLWVNAVSGSLIDISANYVPGGTSDTIIWRWSSLPTNTWFHLAVTIDDVSNGVKLYKDGVEQALTNPNGGSGPFFTSRAHTLRFADPRLYLGRVPVSGQAWEGIAGLQYADTRLYVDHVLTQEEISAIIAANFTIQGDAEITHTLTAADVVLTDLAEAANDAAAATAGVLVGGLYSNAGEVRVRLA